MNVMNDYLGKYRSLKLTPEEIENLKQNKYHKMQMCIFTYTNTHVRAKVDSDLSGVNA